MDYPRDRSHQSEPDPLAVAEDDFAELIHATPPATTRLLVIENISSNLISLAGEILDIDPLFFADYVSTNFEDIERASLPPSLAILPSLISQRGHVHLHYQRVVDLCSADTFTNAAYALKTDSNIPRNVRCLAPLSGRQLALARTCCSLLIKNNDNFSIFGLSRGITLRDLYSHPNLRRMTINGDAFVIENIRGEQFRLLPVNVDGALAFHATPISAIFIDREIGLPKYFSKLALRSSYALVLSTFT